MMNNLEFTGMVLLLSALAGFLGSLTGLGGGVVITPALTLLLIFVILYTMFTSVKWALLILLTVAMAPIGGIAALYLTGTYFSVSSGVGFLALFGVSVQTAVVYISYVNELRRDGTDLAEAIRQGHRPSFADADDALIHDFASELYDTKRVSDVTYRKAVGRFGHQVVINLVGLLGYYALVAMTLNVFDMRAVGQESLPFAE